MDDFDYTVSAELFLRGLGAGGKRLVYKRFASSADAISFAVETAAGFPVVTMEADGQRYEKADIRRLYDAATYPLARKSALAV